MSFLKLIPKTFALARKSIFLKMSITYNLFYRLCCIYVHFIPTLQEERNWTFCTYREKPDCKVLWKSHFVEKNYEPHSAKEWKPLYKRSNEMHNINNLFYYTLQLLIITFLGRNVRVLNGGCAPPAPSPYIGPCSIKGLFIGMGHLME